MRCQRELVVAGRILCRFCVVLVRPAVGSRAILPRGLRVVDALRRVELDSHCPRGDVLCFTQFADKHWTLTVDCVALDQVSGAITVPRSTSGQSIAATPSAH